MFPREGVGDCGLLLGGGGRAGDVIYANYMQITSVGGESEPDLWILQCVVYMWFAGVVQGPARFLGNNEISQGGSGESKERRSAGFQAGAGAVCSLSPAGSRKEPESRQEKRRKGRRPEGKAGDPQRNRSTC